MEIEKNKVTISKARGNRETNLKKPKGLGESDFFQLKNLKLVITRCGISKVHYRMKGRSWNIIEQNPTSPHPVAIRKKDNSFAN